MTKSLVRARLMAVVLALLALPLPIVVAAEHGRVERVEHGHVEFAHGAGVGSVHFAPRVVAPVVVAPHPVPVVRAEEHLAAAEARAAYRNPYRPEYFRRFPPGYHPYVLNGAQYYGYYSLPVGYQPVIVQGITYYLFGGVYYRPYMYGGQTVYVVVPAPV